MMAAGKTSGSNETVEARLRAQITALEK